MLPLFNSKKNLVASSLPEPHRSQPRQKLSRRLTFWLATHWGWLALLALGKLTRIEFRGREHLERLRAAQQPFIICIWHGKILIPIFIHRHQGICAMVSEHRDGEMIAQTLQRLGYATVRGSSTRGGTRAMLGMIRALKAGGTGAITPDGPRGPRHEFKAGMITIAQKSQAAILPLTFASSRVWRLKSWDRFTIPKPFSKTIALYGEPIFIPRETDEATFETLRQQVERHMLALATEVEACFTHEGEL